MRRAVSRRGRRANHATIRRLAMIGRGRVVAILRIAIVRSDSRFDARGGKANLRVAAKKRLHDEQRRDEGDAAGESREEARRGARSDLCCSRRHRMTGPAKEFEDDTRRRKGHSRFLVGRRPNIGAQDRFNGAALLHDSFLTSVAPKTQLPRETLELSCPPASRRSTRRSVRGARDPSTALREQADGADRPGNVLRLSRSRPRRRTEKIFRGKPVIDRLPLRTAWRRAHRRRASRFQAFRD